MPESALTAVSEANSTDALRIAASQGGPFGPSEGPAAIVGSPALADNLLLNRMAERVAVLHQQKEWLQKHQIYFYRPMPEQARFHQSGAHTRLVVGTNRSGKTTCGIVDDIADALGFRPWELPVDLKSMDIEELLAKPHLIPAECRTKIKLPAKTIIIVEDWDVADDILITGTLERAGKLTQYLPPGALDGSPEKNGLGYKFLWRFRNGSTIRIDTEQSFKNNPKSFEGAVYDKVHYDEPKRRDLRVALARGLVDTHGFEIFTFTPLTEPWVKDEIYDRAGLDPEIATFFLHAKKNPYIDQVGWDSFVAKLDVNEKAARAEGEWVHLRGLVYKEFVPKKHLPRNPKGDLKALSGTADAVWPGGHLVDPVPIQWVAKNGSVYVSIDPHSRENLTASILVADRQGRWLVWDELSRDCLIGEFCELLWSKLRFLADDPKKKGEKITRELQVLRWQIDPIAFEEDPVDRTTWADDFMNHGMPVVKSPKKKSQGILDVRAALTEQRLLFCINCTEHIREIQHYMYDEWKNKADRNPKPTPKDKDDHCMECLYRNIVIKPFFVDPDVTSKPIKAKSWCP
jgi:hypothetical protein